ncbi:MAG TPA: bifunctional methylenetetrahydrofolate dehydrogenase/methenyltetrahydrofolate cyclohydrolase FolD [Dehalococcoidia bacterium]|nr:bifunctional methylenetetrahydrofolate dehydrogenase/methenyltetrahydrofolate cyclohydrolase FolD [Dehalococcoidia bacterium]
MTAQLIDGLAVSAAIRAELTERVARLRAKGFDPGLAFVIVGENPASISYVRSKAKACEETGLSNETINLPESTSQEELLDLVRRLNADPRWSGMIVQLPLPKHIDPNTVALTIDPDKDADAMHPYNVGRMLIGMPGPKSCTPNGVVELLMRTGNDPDGKHVVIVGRSNIVGKPLAALLMQKAKGANATVTVCHTGTRDLAYHTRQAEILVVAAGVPNAVTAEMVRPGAVVIDVGNNRVPDPTRKSGFRMVGDVDFEGVKEVASWITPVPGGVGPMTVTMLLANTVAAAERAAGMAQD